MSIVTYKPTIEWRQAAREAEPPASSVFINTQKRVHDRIEALLFGNVFQSTPQDQEQFLRSIIGPTSDGEAKPIAEDLAKIGTPHRFRNDPAFTDQIISEIRQALAAIPSDEVKQLLPLARAYGQAIRHISGHARRVAAALTATNEERYNARQDIRQAMLKDFHHLVLSHLQFTARLGFDAAETQEEIDELNTKSSYFSYLTTLEKMYPKARAELDARWASGIELSRYTDPAPAERIDEIAALIGQGFSASRIPYFRREFATGKLEMFTTSEAPEINKSSTAMGCVGLYHINDQWQVVDWWARRSGDNRLQNALVRAAVYSHPTKRTISSCNWHSSVLAAQTDGICMSVERGSDPPVAYLSTIVLKEDERKRCLAKQPEHRHEMLELCATATNAPGIFCKGMIGGQPHYAIRVSPTQEQQKAYIRSQREGKPYELGTQMFDAVHEAQNLCSPPPVLTWIEQGATNKERILIFGPNPLSEADMTSYTAAKKTYNSELKQIHAPAQAVASDVQNSLAASRTTAHFLPA